MAHVDGWDCDKGACLPTRTQPALGVYRSLLCIKQNQKKYLNRGTVYIAARFPIGQHAGSCGMEVLAPRRKVHQGRRSAR